MLMRLGVRALSLGTPLLLLALCSLPSPSLCPTRHAPAGRQNIPARLQAWPPANVSRLPALTCSMLKWQRVQIVSKDQAAALRVLNPIPGLSLSTYLGPLGESEP